MCNANRCHQGSLSLLTLCPQLHPSHPLQTSLQTVPHFTSSSKPFHVCAVNTRPPTHTSCTDAAIAACLLTSLPPSKGSPVLPSLSSCVHLFSMPCEERSAVLQATCSAVAPTTPHPSFYVAPKCGQVPFASFATLRGALPMPADDLAVLKATCMATTKNAEAACLLTA